MPRTIAVRVGYITPPAYQSTPDDATGLIDTVALLMSSSQSVSDALGLTDSAVGQLGSGAVFGGNFGGNF